VRGSAAPAPSAMPTATAASATCFSEIIGKKSNKKSGMRKKHFLNLEKNPILIRLFTSQKKNL
jgi:hypothetical protein